MHITTKIKIIFQSSVIGCLFALIYSFISFYLLSGLIIGNLGALFFYGFQGTLAGACYSTLVIISEGEFSKKIATYEVAFHASIGVLSGAISSIPNLYLSWLGSRENSIPEDVYITADMINHNYTFYINYMIGSACLCLLIGLVVGYLKSIKNTA